MAEAYQLGPNAIREAATAERIIGILEEHRWLSHVEKGMVIDGKFRRKVWQLWSPENPS